MYQKWNYMAENNIKTGKNVVFLWKKTKSIENATYKNIENDLKKIMNEMEMFI